MNILIEELKQKHTDHGAKCDVQYKNINAALRKGNFNKANKARVGYTEIWDQFNKMEDFLKSNNINYYTDYGNKRIMNPNIY